MDDDADAKMILTAPPPENWKRPPGRPRITWLNTGQQDLRAYNLTVNKAVNLAQNRHLSWSVEADVYVWRYALLAVKPQSRDCGLWRQSVAAAAYRALETETAVR